MPEPLRYAGRCRPGSGQVGTLESSGRYLYIVAWSVCKVQPSGWHSTRRSLLEAIEVIACELAHLLSGELASFSLSGVERSTKLHCLDLVDSMANGVLGRQEPSGGKFRLHPLGCIRCKFNFHRACSFCRSFPYREP